MSNIASARSPKPGDKSNKGKFGGDLKSVYAWWDGDVENAVILCLVPELGAASNGNRSSSRQTRRGGSFQCGETTCKTVCQRML